MTAFAHALDILDALEPRRITGSVAALKGLSILADDLPLPVGSLVSVDSDGPTPTLGELVGFSREHAIIMPLAQTTGVRPGARVTGIQITQTVPVSTSLLGRVIDGLGRPIDRLGPIHDAVPRPINPAPISPLQRRRIDQRLETGVRSIDLMNTLGRGQRLGIFAGPGVGKSTLLGTVVRRTNADVCVVALIGERGREVKDFIEHALGPEGLARSVVVVATGDESPLLRLRAAKAACTVAEMFRDQGKDVLLVMDSVTRFAHAQRQVGLSVGEPPATKGYTPSVFAQLALLLERAGSLEARPGLPAGSITGLYTILVEGDDMTEPVADAARGILDGHIILSRKLAQKAHHPAVDVLDSVSRVADDVSDKPHQHARRQASRLLALYREIEDLVQIGAYAKGSSPEHDVAIDVHPSLTALMRQGRDEATPFEKARAQLVELTTRAAEQLERLKKGKGR